MPASAAISRVVVPAKPFSPKPRSPASMIANRVSLLSRCPFRFHGTLTFQSND